MVQLFRLFHTVKHLTLSQTTGQIAYRIRRKLGHGSFRFQMSRRGILSIGRMVSFLPPNLYRNSPLDIRELALTFINIRKYVGWPPDWRGNGEGKLWLYNLHYFEWIWGLDYDSVRVAIENWIDTYRCGYRQAGWEAYPTSLRVMNWLGYCFGRYYPEVTADSEFKEKILRSLGEQVQWLSRNMEYHLLGNHLFENTAALTLAGACLEGVEAEVWLKKGSTLLLREIGEQVLPDGMHFELSPMYHSRMVYVLLLLYPNVSNHLRDYLREPLFGMLVALQKITHPDGHIALLNDSAFGIYPIRQELLWYAEKCRIEVPPPEYGVWKLKDAGYYGYRGEDGSFLICDAARIGPDYIPGHAHADIFTFELSLRGTRVIVDSGVHDYEIGEMRNYCRSTRAHNTVEIDGYDQSEMWGAFRVARRGEPHNVAFEENENGFHLSGWHDGYCRLPRKSHHHRDFTWHDSGRLIILDRVESSREVEAISRIHLHPDCYIQEFGESWATIQFKRGAFRVEFIGNGSLYREESRYCPEFNVKIPNIALAYRFTGKQAEVTCTIAITDN